MSRRVIGPINRVEGDLALTLTLENGRVAHAEVSSPLFRGFERILAGRHAQDALAIVPRICGICSVSQAMAAVNALEVLYGVSAPPNGQKVRNLVHAIENLCDHLTHFTLFFMPDFAHDAYRARRWHARAASAFTAQRGSAHAPMLEARATLMRVVGLVAGHWPHTMSLQAGGVTRTVSATERVRLARYLALARRYLETTLFGCPLEAISALSTPAGLAAYRDAHPHAQFALFLEVADDLDLYALGRCDAPLIAACAYPSDDGPLSDALCWQDGKPTPLDTATISEDVAHSRYAGEAAHPFAADTLPLPAKAGAYSWNRAPRLAGAPAQTGALARALARGDALSHALMRAGGSNVASRTIARVREIALLLPAMETWLASLALAEPFAVPCPPIPLHERAEGLTEAARGMLGHWVTLEGERIARYQIIAPTGWNFSPRDAAGVCGPLEAALAGTEAPDAQALTIQHIVRSFDPCQVCTTH
ncbi:nickel-dependent hydrogenase large subunit [Crenobacter caeni]|uniref:Nickel-dependent hydrogenase large subunit n=1 Tax=Crenobacter caeni TaxID=2705474 RepID=A0A6B2KUY8_9NEIS|nr:nickel-dependent hydrogenase large subunit [Crenobacter caeni]NDV13971.1 nickel-dependent hydrogenase large subunit [Crenobacter caeni]